MGLLAVFFSTLVVLGYLVTIWWLDRYEREPWWVIASTFAWGGLGGTCFAIVLSAIPAMALTPLFGEDVSSVVSTVMVAPVVEEITKALVFVPLFLTRHIDTETDGLIYGAATGLGFAAVENLIYYVGAGDALYSTIILRTLFSTFVHCIASSMVGIGVGWARHRSWTSSWAIVVGYVAAVATHGTWNGLAVLTEKSGQGLVFVLSCGLLTGAGLMMFGLTQWMLIREHRVLQRILRMEAGRGTLSATDADAIPFWTKRGTIKHPKRRELIRLATLLAFRHHQFEQSGALESPKAVAELERLRGELGALRAG